MTADDAPRTLFGAIERELRSVAAAGAMDVAVTTTEAGSPERTNLCEVAHAQFDEPRHREARELLDYLGEHFGAPHPMTKRDHDDRDLLITERLDETERKLYRADT